MLNINTLSDLLKDHDDSKLEFSLRGLLKGHIGMLIAAPNVGKSHLALCIGMEHAAPITLVGLSVAELPQKTLIISSEDSAAVLKSRMEKKLKKIPPKAQKVLLKNLLFSSDTRALVIPSESNRQELESHCKYLTELAYSIKEMEIDLVIIDTVTESIGQCDEVKHDRLIKNTLQSLAKSSGAAILLVHHVNKNEIRGEQEITMASGAGLTSVMRLTKCLFTLQNDKKGNLSIRFLKSNYFKNNEIKEFNVEFDDSLIVDRACFDLSSRKSANAKIKPKNNRQEKKILSEPKMILLSVTQENHAPIDDMRDVL